MDTDPVAKTKSVIHEEGGDIIVENVSDVEDIVELNKASFNQTKRHDSYGEMEQVASIPMVIFMDLQARGVLDDEKAFRKWLNDPDNRAFRTRPGKV